jgi:Spy/CpxP family protein refolding chaperone
MMRTAVLLCGLGLIAGVAVAQDDAPPPPPQGGQMQGPPGGRHGWGGEHRVERMKHELNLTDDQTAQVKAIFADSRTKMEALRGNSSLSREDRRSQMMAIHQTEESKIDGVLTPDQKTKYDAMQARMRERMQDRHEGGGAGQAPGDTQPPPPPPPPNPQN